MTTPIIQTTEDYSLFETIVGNRNTSPTKIDRIVQDIKKGINLLPYCPIIVYKNAGLLAIIDGQHRFAAAKKVESAIYFIVAHELSLFEIAMLNSRQDKWTKHDFLKCYIKLGVEDYVTLKWVMDNYHISISLGYDLLMMGKTGSSGSAVGDKFTTGKFKVHFYEETLQLLALTNKLFDRYKFSRDRHLITAVQQLMQKGLCDFDQLEEKINSAPMLMVKQVSAKEYIYNIERVYNHKNQKRQVIF